MKIYVNVNAARGGNGSKESPFKAINDAAKIAVAGDEIIVAPGIYREYVNPVHSGREDARITYRSEIPLGAVITGAELVTDWEKYDGTTYVTRVDNTVFGDYNPYIQEVEGDWYFANNHMHTEMCMSMTECSMRPTPLRSALREKCMREAGSLSIPFINGSPPRIKRKTKP